MPKDMTDVPNNVHYSLFKGEPGTRKSSQALTYPGPQYWFSFDGKMNALTIPMKKYGIDPKTIEYDDYFDWQKAQTKLNEFKLNCQYKTIIIDSITTCADYMLKQVISQKLGTTRKSGQQAGKIIGGIAVNEMEDYNAEAGGLTALITDLKDIQKFHGIDVILIAHVVRKDMKDINGNVQVTRSIVTAGKAPAAKIPAYCDETYHFGVRTSGDASKGGDFLILTRSNGDDFARTTLELDAEIEHTEKNLYRDIVRPAIDKQKTT